jgi:hypothetical protein
MNRAPAIALSLASGIVVAAMSISTPSRIDRRYTGGVPRELSKSLSKQVHLVGCVKSSPTHLRGSCPWWNGASSRT